MRDVSYFLTLGLDIDDRRDARTRPASATTSTFATPVVRQRDHASTRRG